MRPEYRTGPFGFVDSLVPFEMSPLNHYHAPQYWYSNFRDALFHALVLKGDNVSRWRIHDLEASASLIGVQRIHM